MKNTLPAAPDRASASDGLPLFGAYRGIIPDASFSSLDPDHARTGLARLRTEKCWHYINVAGPEWMACVAVVRLGYAGVAFAYLFDRRTRNFVFDRTQMAPPLIGARIAEKPGDGAETSFRLPGFHASLLHPPGQGRYVLRLRMTGGEQLFDLATDLYRQEGPDALSAICPVKGKGSVNLTVKQVALPARGRLIFGDETWNFDKDHYAMVDFSHGYLDRTTSWMWACAGGRTPRGRTLGLNLVAGFNDSLENAIWVGKDLVPVGPVTFHRDTSGPSAPWNIQDEAGKLELTFTPEGARSEQKDVGPISSHYFQPVGTFSGKLTDARGKPVKLEGLTGVCEEHHSRW